MVLPSAVAFSLSAGNEAASADPITPTLIFMDQTREKQLKRKERKGSQRNAKCDSWRPLRFDLIRSTLPQMGARRLTWAMSKPWILRRVLLFGPKTFEW